MFKKSLERRRARGGQALNLPPLSSFQEPDSTRNTVVDPPQ
jgi:hypothetical protein